VITLRGLQLGLDFTRQSDAELRVIFDFLAGARPRRRPSNTPNPLGDLSHLSIAVSSIAVFVLTNNLFV